jgi:hypothetical protein
MRISYNGAMLPTILLLLWPSGIYVSANSVTPPAMPLPSPAFGLRPPPQDEPGAQTFRTVVRGSSSLSLPLALPPSEPQVKLARPTTPPAPAPAVERALNLRATAATAAAAPPAPAITEAPAADAAADGALIVDDDGEWVTGVDGNGKTFRFKQTTYFSCVTRGTYSHCGWHRPILEVSAAAGGLGRSAGEQGPGLGLRVMVAAVAAGFVAALMGR